ncbi:PIR protein, partial [Plasmodium vivax]
MLNPAIEDLILDYNIYSTIIEKFGTNRNQVFDTNYDVVLKHAEVEQAKRTKYDKTYKEVYRHLHNSGVMYDYMAQGCKYISYLIHKDVKNTLDLYYDEEIFKIFRKFVEDYYNVLKHAEVEQAKRTKYDKTYKEVYRHLHNSGVMYDYMAQG